MVSGTKGTCYLCGGEFGKVAMKNHLLKSHGVADQWDPAAQQACYLLKAEGAYDKGYWLYFDAPITASLSNIDDFLRAIWLECCGHMSAFFGQGYSEIGKTRKLSGFAPGDKFRHEYDFGSTTETVITVVTEVTRAKQKNAVRLLARNVPPAFICSVCAENATALCIECMYEIDNPFFCAACGEKHPHEGMLLPVTNSPRMGVCGYDGELDVFAFDPKALLKKGKK